MPAREKSNEIVIRELSPTTAALNSRIKLNDRDAELKNHIA